MSHISTHGCVVQFGKRIKGISHKGPAADEIPQELELPMSGTDLLQTSYGR